MTTSKPIGNPLHRDVEKVATSFYVSNFLDSLDARGLWNICTPCGASLMLSLLINDRTEPKQLRYQSYTRAPQPNPNPNPTYLNPNPNNTSKNINDLHSERHSFASVVHGNPKSSSGNTLHDKIRVVSLDDQDLTDVDDMSRVLQVKLKDLCSASNMYVICKNKGFADLKIDHVGGSWIWIQFPMPEACENFRLNTTMINISYAIKTVTPSFKVDCINIVDDSLDSSSTEDENDIEKVADTFEDNSVDDLDDVIKYLNNDKADDETNIEPPNVNAEDSQPPKETNASDLSCPPGFEHLKRGSSSRTNENSKKQDAIKAIKILDDKIEDDCASKEDCYSRINILHEIYKLDSFEAMDNIQKARIKWDQCCKTRKMPLGSNSSFITLIPKVSNPVNVNDFWHISLIGIHYKITAKVLANRLSIVVDKIVGHEKFAFITSRQILDGPPILSEAIDWYKKRKKNMFLFKVDFEKAFDSRISKLNVRRGLRQGDPIYAFLFIIIMEGFMWRSQNLKGGFDLNGCKFNGIWSKIIRTSNYLHSSSILLMDSICFQVGCGSLIRFRKDIWLGNWPLYILFNRLFRLEQKKNCLVVDRISNGQYSWNWSRSTLGIRNSFYLNNMLAKSAILRLEMMWTNAPGLSRMMGRLMLAICAPSGGVTDWKSEPRLYRTRGTTLVEAILVKGHELPTKVNSFPVAIVSSWTVTYTSISSDYEEPSDASSPGVVVYRYDRLPMHPVDPYAEAALQAPEQAPPFPDYVPGPEHPPSPDYMPGPKEPEQAPLSPDYIPEPECPEYLAPSDDPKEDPKEDHADYPADGGDDADDELSDDDDDDDDEEEEEHLALADSTAFHVIDLVPSTEDTEAFETKESTLHLYHHLDAARLGSSPPPSPLSPLSSPLPQIPSSPLPLSSLPTTSPRYAEAPLGYRARARFTPPTGRFEVGESSSATAARQVRHILAHTVDYGFINTMDASIYDVESRAMTTMRMVNDKVTDLATTQRIQAMEAQIRALHRVVDVLQRQRARDEDRLTAHIQHEHDRFRELIRTTEAEPQD
nr:cysteine-rich receptor-like protein kinase [Tanacetum cinerariifolium]